MTVVCGFLHKKCNASLTTQWQSNGSESVLVTLFPFTHPTVTSKSLSVFCTTVIGFYICYVVLTWLSLWREQVHSSITKAQNKLTDRNNVSYKNAQHTHTHAQFKVEILWKEMCSLVLWPISLYVQLSNNTWEVETHNEGK